VSARSSGLVVGGQEEIAPPLNFGLLENAKFGAEKPTFWGKFRGKIKSLSNIISSVGNLQLFVGKLQIPAPPSFLTHDAAGAQSCHRTEYVVWRVVWRVQLEAADQIALIAAGFSQLLCLRIASDFGTAASTGDGGGQLLPIGGGLGVMLPSGSLVDHSSTTSGHARSSTTDHIYSIFESIVQFSVELGKLDLDVTEMAMFAAATLVQPGTVIVIVIIIINIIIIMNVRVRADDQRHALQCLGLQKPMCLKSFAKSRRV